MFIRENLNAFLFFNNSGDSNTENIRIPDFSCSVFICSYHLDTICFSPEIESYRPGPGMMMMMMMMDRTVPGLANSSRNTYALFWHSVFWLSG